MKYYQGRGMVLYASKAFSCKEIVPYHRKMKALDSEVVSGGRALYGA